MRVAGKLSLKWSLSVQLLLVAAAGAAPTATAAAGTIGGLLSGGAEPQPRAGGTSSCSVRLNRTLGGDCGGDCPGSWSRLHGGCPWGCAADAHSMFAIRGCCGVFECDAGLLSYRRRARGWGGLGGALEVSPSEELPDSSPGRPLRLP